MHISEIKKDGRYLFSWGTGSHSTLKVTNVTSDRVYGIIEPEIKDGIRADCAGGINMDLNEADCRLCIEYEIVEPEDATLPHGTVNILVKKSYLARFVNAEKMYPVSYTFNTDGSVNKEPFFLKGGDLTENQILELFQNQLL